MPTYEYECKSCNHSFEAFQNISEEPIKDCPQCGKEVRRLINGGAGIIFKGSGFYAKDKNATPPAPQSGEKNAGKGTETGTSGKDASSPCASCPAAASDKGGGACPASQKAAG